MGTEEDPRRNSDAMVSPSSSSSSGYWSTNDDELSQVSSLNLDPDGWFFGLQDDAGKEERTPETEAACPQPSCDSSLPDFLFFDFLQTSKSTDLEPDLPEAAEVMAEGTDWELDLTDLNDEWREHFAENSDELRMSADELIDDMFVDSPRIPCPDEFFQGFPGHRLDEDADSMDGLMSPITFRMLATDDEPEGQWAGSSGCASPLDVSSEGSGSRVYSDSYSAPQITDLVDPVDLLNVLLNETPAHHQTHATTLRQGPEVHMSGDVSATPDLTRKRKSVDNQTRRRRKIARTVGMNVSSTTRDSLETTEEISDQHRISAPPETEVACDCRESHVTAEPMTSVIVKDEVQWKMEKSNDKEPLPVSDDCQKMEDSEGVDVPPHGTVNCECSPRERFLQPSPANEEETAERDGSTTVTNGKTMATPMTSDGTRSAEVLETLLGADCALKDPNRGSDVIFAELRNRRLATSCPRSSSAEEPPNQSHSKKNTSQNLLHRLLRGQTSEAEVRRELAARQSQETNPEKTTHGVIKVST